MPTWGLHPHKTWRRALGHRMRSVPQLKCGSKDSRDLIANLSLGQV